MQGWMEMETGGEVGFQSHPHCLGHQILGERINNSACCFNVLSIRCNISECVACLLVISAPETSKGGKRDGDHQAGISTAI